MAIGDLEVVLEIESFQRGLSCLATPIQMAMLCRIGWVPSSDCYSQLMQAKCENLCHGQLLLRALLPIDHSHSIITRQCT